MVGTHSVKFGEGLLCDIRSQFAHVQLLRTPTKFVGLLRGKTTKNAGSQCSFVLDVRDSKVWHAQSRNPLEMLVDTSSAHFPFLRNKGGSQWRQLRPEWKPQHRSGKNSQEVPTPTCREACEPCDLLWKLTLSRYPYWLHSFELGVHNIVHGFESTGFCYREYRVHGFGSTRVHSLALPRRLGSRCDSLTQWLTEEWVWLTDSDCQSLSPVSRTDPSVLVRWNLHGSVYNAAVPDTGWSLLIAVTAVGLPIFRHYLSLEQIQSHWLTSSSNCQLLPTPNVN